MSTQEGAYRVVYPEMVRSALIGYIDELLQGGWTRTAIASLLQMMDDRLRHAPGDFGEPLYTLPVLRLRVAVGFVRPFAVQFGVRDDNRTVFVRKIILLTPQAPSA